MLLLHTKTNNDKCTLHRGPEVVGEMSLEHAKLLQKMEKQNQTMAMMLRMIASGSDMKEKAAEYLAKENLNNPLRQSKKTSF